VYANVPTNAELAPTIERILSREKSAWNARFGFDIPTHSYHGSDTAFGQIRRPPQNIPFRAR
jgi:hypothetical protein